MLSSPASTLVRDDRPAYRPYRAAVARVEQLSPSFRRVTFAGDDFGVFGTDGLDQRVKIMFPVEGVGLSDVGLEGDWYARWRALPNGERNPFRTYTVRAIRPWARELDVDFVVHGDVGGVPGPAARWLGGAEVDDEVVIIGPDARSVHSKIGIDWHPGAASDLLLAGDETAAPAICSILQSLPPGVKARAFIEVPTAGDFLDIVTHATVTWIARDESAPRLDEAVREWIANNRRVLGAALIHEPQVLEDIDVDVELLWDSPADATAGFYAWIAGESALVKGLRRLLVTETGVDRSRVAFMGYWRLGKAEAQ